MRPSVDTVNHIFIFIYIINIINIKTTFPEPINIMARLVPYRTRRQPRNTTQQLHPSLKIRSFEHTNQNTHYNNTECQSVMVHPKQQGGFKNVCRVMSVAGGKDSEFAKHLNEMSTRMKRLTTILTTEKRPSIYAPMYRLKYWAQDQ